MIYVLWLGFGFTKCTLPNDVSVFHASYMEPSLAKKCCNKTKTYAKGFIQLQEGATVLDEIQLPTFKYPKKNYTCCAGSWWGGCPIPSCCCLLSDRGMTRALTVVLLLNGMWSLITTWTGWDPFSFNAFSKNEILGQMCVVPELDNFTFVRTTDYVPLANYSNVTLENARTYYYATQAVYQYGFEVYPGVNKTTAAAPDGSAYTWPQANTGNEDEIGATLSTTCKYRYCFVGEGSKNGFLSTGWDCLTFDSVPCGDLDRVAILQENLANEVLLSTLTTAGQNTTYNTSLSTMVEDAVYEQMSILSDRLTTAASFYPLYTALMIFAGKGYFVVGKSLLYRLRALLNNCNWLGFTLFFTLSWYLIEQANHLAGFDFTIQSIPGLQNLIPSLCYVEADGYVELLDEQTTICNQLDKAKFYVEQGIDSVNYYSTVENTYGTESKGIYDPWANNISHYRQLVENSTTYDCEVEALTAVIDSEFSLHLKWISFRLIYKALIPILITNALKHGFNLLSPLASVNGRIVMPQPSLKGFAYNAHTLQQAYTANERKSFLLPAQGPLALPHHEAVTAANIRQFVWSQNLLPFSLYLTLLIYIWADLA